MIGKLKGVIDKISDNQIILDVGGVGYLVYASNNTIGKIGNVGSSASLTIETFVREDAINLYGFADEDEKFWFIQLNKVSGVGAKVALAILSHLKPRDLILAISSADKKLISSVPGIGPKIAERIITELKNIAGKSSISAPSAEIVKLKNGKETISENNIIFDATSALENLGFTRSDAFSVVSNLHNKNKEISLEDLIKNGLKGLASRG
ncbi:MAG: Holliday junction branch migration protein RuvA, partial [Rickettsiales bacterium]|nr:Holliday junction branch migration protein RuvA [Rickettsiales bacterium]